ncbi:MAG: hypothetical protein AAGA25_08850 [Planctomycetota bacterium]
MRFPLTASVVLAATLVTGCETSRERQTTPSAGEGLTLRIDGTAQMLGHVSKPPESNEIFGRELTAMVRQNHLRSAKYWLRYRFDEAERLLIAPGDTPPEVLTFLALRWDERSGGLGGWYELLQDRLTRTEVYESSDAAYRGWYRAARSGQFDLGIAEKITSPPGAPAPWLQVESYRLQAVALLTDGDPSGAAARWVSAAELAQPWSPRISKQLRLMAASAWLSDQQFDQAAEAWQLATDRITLYDLDSATTLSLLIQVQEKLQGVSDTNLVSSRFLYYRLGEVRLARNEPQAALVAFRKAESQLGTEPATPTLRLAQADALVALGQRDTARAILVELTNSPQHIDAIARLGVIDLRSGRLSQGRRLLRTASQKMPIEDDPQIHADYALALIATGETSKGLDLLAKAREYFLQRGDFESIKKSLHNEQLFAQAEGLRDQVHALDSKLKALEMDRFQDSHNSTDD